MFYCEKTIHADKYYMVIRKRYKYGETAQFVEISEGRFHKLKLPLYQEKISYVAENELIFL
ncbi:hypothetical protein [Effusibacillus dendaii]|uniref:Uncharacterized protein n=1 Tax=Effusibacillus dendaii TaxID=2743772 RepID=A0A7I8D574_9BACL|nr:hypothetical protein [Effusibacillus dendaii]BCJ85217.1 hypothetical protein skT53_02020 [Effusibacillus dendaii]